MTDSPHSAEIIPFDQVRRIVQERRRLAAQTDTESDALMPLPASGTSQVRRILSEQRAAARPGADPDLPS